MSPESPAAANRAGRRPARPWRRQRRGHGRCAAAVRRRPGGLGRPSRVASKAGRSRQSRSVQSADHTSSKLPLTTVRAQLTSAHPAPPEHNRACQTRYWPQVSSGYSLRSSCPWQCRRRLKMTPCSPRNPIVARGPEPPGACDRQPTTGPRGGGHRGPARRPGGGAGEPCARGPPMCHGWPIGLTSAAIRGLVRGAITITTATPVRRARTHRLQHAVNHGQRPSAGE